MSRKNLGVTHLRGRSALHQRSRSKYDAQTPNRPKPPRGVTPERVVPALVDPIKTLGHPPRGRKQRQR